MRFRFFGGGGASRAAAVEDEDGPQAYLTACATISRFQITLDRLTISCPSGALVEKGKTVQFRCGAAAVIGQASGLNRPLESGC